MDVKNLSDESLLERMKNAIEFDFEVNGNKFKFLRDYSYGPCIFSIEYHVPETEHVSGTRWIASYSVDNGLVQFCNNFDPNDPIYAEP